MSFLQIRRISCHGFAMAPCSSGSVLALPPVLLSTSPMADTILLTLTAEELKDLLRRGFA